MQETGNRSGICDLSGDPALKDPTDSIADVVFRVRGLQTLDKLSSL